MMMMLKMMQTTKVNKMLTIMKMTASAMVDDA